MRMLSPHINNKAMINKNKQCPEFPYFGATYPDARCIGGCLYDLDDCNENGNLIERGNDLFSISCLSD